MKAKPIRQRPTDNVFEPCEPSEATHIRLQMPCPMSDRVLPVITKGNRKDTPCWTWNGDTEKPTLKPSILTRFETRLELTVCHSFVTDGKVQFLSDCTHEFAGQTLELLDVD